MITRGNTVVGPPPVLPQNRPPLAFTSSSVASPDALHDSVTRLSTIGLPIQLNCAASKRMPGSPSAWSTAVLCTMRADRGAVLRRDVVEPVRGGAGAGARHVLRHEGRIAGDVPRPVARHRAGVEVVAAADVEADHQLDALAGEERRSSAPHGALIASAEAAAPTCEQERCGMFTTCIIIRP